MTQKSFNIYRTREYVKIATEIQPSDDTHFMNRVDAILERSLDAASFEFYQSMIDAFDTYPEIKEMKPEWRPVVDGGHFQVNFTVQVKNSSNEGIQNQRCNYDNPPSFASYDGEKTFSILIELGEGIRPELWNAFLDRKLNNRKMPYVGPEDIKEEMSNELGEFITLFEQYALTHQTPHAKGQPRRKTL